MDLLSNFEPWWRFAAALFIGALIGLEREYVRQRSEDPEFAGIRTFSLMALLGAIAAYLSREHGLLLFVIAYVGITLLVWATYLGDVMQGHEEGITTEVVALIVPLLGGIVVWGEFALAASLGVIVAFVLALKPVLHGLARRMSASDLRATLEFALITAVVLPILPNQSFGPFGVLNPFQVWLLVVFVSGIGFFGYVLIKILGAEQGVGLTGVLGGLVSSTATTVSFAGRSKDSPELSSIFAQGIVLSSSVMLPRVFIEVAVVHPPLLRVVSIPLGAMMLVSLGSVFYLWRNKRHEASEARKQVEVSNPLRLKTAITFALAFSVVLIVVRASNEFFGEAGVYVASILTGITDVDAITLTASELASVGQIAAPVAAVAVLLATLVNTLAKGVMAWILGTPQLRPTIVRAFGLVLLTGILSTALTVGIWLT
jgi:uncharacterized membrane protein (DUF4010 family)